MTHGAAAARPQLDLLGRSRTIVRSSRSLAFAADVVVSPNTITCAPAGFTLSTISRPAIGAEYATPRPQLAASMPHPACPLRGVRRPVSQRAAGSTRRARVQPEERAEDVPHRRGHQVFMRDTGRLSMPLIADLRKHWASDIAEQFERRQDRRQRRSRGRWPGIEFLQGGGERGGIERRPCVGTTASAAFAPAVAGQTAQFRIGEPGEAPDAVSVFDRAAQQPQARNVGVGVHPAAVVTAGRDSAMAALPGAQRVDPDAGQPGDRPDRIACRRLARPAHPDPNLTTAAHAADATVPQATSASVSTNGHCRSVE